MRIDRAIADRNLLGCTLGDLSTWQTWLVVLKAAHGLELTSSELALFSSVSGGRAPPGQPVKELWAV
jgi:hypothetical protein